MRMTRRMDFDLVLAPPCSLKFTAFREIHFEQKSRRLDSCQPGALLQAGMGRAFGVGLGMLFQRFICCLSVVTFWGLAFYVWEASLVSGEDIDRLIAAVNRKVITEGDLDLARKLNVVVFQDKNTKPRSRKEEIDRLIELELMRQELKNFSLTQEDENKIAARMQLLRAEHAEKGGLPVLLRNLNLQETELLSYLRLESSILKFVDFRFRPFINITEVEIKDYYETRFIPQLRESKLAVPELAQVLAKIEEILKEEKINAALEQWIHTVRNNSRIEYFKQDSEVSTRKSE
jgi:hypothetical protein